MRLRAWPTQAAGRGSALPGAVCAPRDRVRPLFSVCSHDDRLRNSACQGLGFPDRFGVALASRASVAVGSRGGKEGRGARKESADPTPRPDDEEAD